MEDTIKWILRHLHLIISLIIVVPTALIYGISPAIILSKYLNIEVLTIDLSSFLRAIMFLYLGFAIIWLSGLIDSKYWKIATQSNVLFMLTLAFGRLLSMALDGKPSDGYIFAFISEVTIGMLAIYRLKKTNQLIK